MKSPMEPLKKNTPAFVIRTLGRFDVIKGDCSLIKSSPGSKKLWELYKFMLTHRDRSFTPEALMDQLWVSEEYNDPRSTLRRQMHRLRQTLAEEDCHDSERTLLFSNGFYRWNDSLSLTIDAEDFERLTQKGDLLAAASPEEALNAYREALDLYSGDYLPECVDQHWVYPFRNHLRRCYLKAVQSATALLREKEAYDEILRITQKAVQLDIYEEQFHLSLMEALLISGDPKRALEHYEYITGFYYREMGIKPSAEMRALYKRMLKSPVETGHGSLTDTLEADLVLENAYFCDFEVFRSIYELERRRSQRSGAGFCVGVLTAHETKGYSASQGELQMNHLKTHLMEGLRQGDTFSRWTDRQFVVLLAGVDAEMAQRVLKRVIGGDHAAAGVVIDQVTYISTQTKEDHLPEALRL